jgi:hypothetical protein
MYRRPECLSFQLNLGSISSSSSSIALSSAALGKEKQASIIAPTITVFLPRSLRRDLKRSPHAHMILGWCFKAEATNNKLVIVVAGLVSRKQMTESQIGLAGNGGDIEAEACVIGTCKTVGPVSIQDVSGDLDNKSCKLWLEVLLSADRETTPQTAFIAGLRAPVETQNAAQCAINVIIYTTPKSERMKYLSLEPMVLPKASSAGVLDRARNEAYNTKGQQLQHKLESLIKLDPLRHRDLNTQHHHNRGPGQGFRRAVHLVSLEGQLEVGPSDLLLFFAAESVQLFE